MKKIFSALLALVMLMGAVFMLASCGARPELDLEEAEKNLKDKGYTVSYVKDYEDERSITAVLNASDSEENNYNLQIIKYENSAIAKVSYKKIKAQHDSAVEKLEYELEYYEAYLKAYEDEMSSEDVDKYNDRIKALDKQIENMKEYVIGRSGKYVWYGDKEAVDASKGK